MILKNILIAFIVNFLDIDRKVENQQPKKINGENTVRKINNEKNVTLESNFDSSSRERDMVKNSMTNFSLKYFIKEKKLDLFF